VLSFISGDLKIVLFLTGLPVPADVDRDTPPR
jgi:hypothetical protein